MPLLVLLERRLYLFTNEQTSSDAPSPSRVGHVKNKPSPKAGTPTKNHGSIKTLNNFINALRGQAMKFTKRSAQI